MRRIFPFFALLIFVSCSDKSPNAPKITDHDRIQGTYFLFSYNDSQGNVLQPPSVNGTLSVTSNALAFQITLNGTPYSFNCLYDYVKKNELHADCGSAGEGTIAYTFENNKLTLYLAHETHEWIK